MLSNLFLCFCSINLFWLYLSLLLLLQCTHLTFVICNFCLFISAYNIILNNCNWEQIDFFKIIWELKAIHNALHFVWRVGLNCVAQKIIKIKNMQLSYNLWVCKVQHFFFECMIFNFVWNLCFKWFIALTTQHSIIKLYNILINFICLVWM